MAPVPCHRAMARLCGPVRRQASLSGQCAISSKNGGLGGKAS